MSRVMRATAVRHAVFGLALAGWRCLQLLPRMLATLMGKHTALIHAMTPCRRSIDAPRSVMHSAEFCRSDE